MCWPARVALIGLLASVAASAFAAPEDNQDAKEDAVAAPSLEGLVGQKLFSIDGSSIALVATEDGLSRQIVAPNGAMQKTYFRFLSEKLGTVSDDRDTSAVVGVFRFGGAALDVQYSDGSTETLLANGGGGISLETKSPGDGPSCTNWYPEGHAFSIEERKAALARYAVRLGLSDAAGKDALLAPHVGCNGGAVTAAVEHAKTEAKTEVVVHPTTVVTAAEAKAAKDAPPVVVATAEASGPVAASATAVAPAVSDVAPAPVTPRATAKTGTLKFGRAKTDKEIEVRPSEVQPIDRDPSVEPKQPQQFASLEPQKSTPVMKPLGDQIGASSCLSVESDGMHWGFRNRCGYTVQFAYCVLDNNPLASCKDGAVTGSVAGDGFGALLADDSLRETDVAHHFRWVACQGGAGEVLPRLDQIDPPMGRCVH